MNPKISIIVPVYKVEQYLPKCIDSILSQTYQNWELLLIDDGSPDRSGEICDEYAKKDSRVRVFHKENGGVSSARNLGLDNARGEWITFSDSDDEMFPYALSNYMQIAQKDSNIDIIKCGYVKYNELDNTETVYSCDEECISNDKSIIVQILNNSSSYHGFLWNECIRKSCISDLRFDESITWNEDNLFSYKCFIVARKIAISPQLVYLYKIRDRASLSCVKNPYYVINTSAAILYYRLQMLGIERDTITVKENFINKYINMFHSAVKLLNSEEYCYRVNEFKDAIVFKEYLNRDITARLFLNCKNPQMSLIVWKISNSVRVLLNRMTKI